LARLAINFKTQEMAAFSTFLRFLKWKMELSANEAVVWTHSFRGGCFGRSLKCRPHKTLAKGLEIFNASPTRGYEDDRLTLAGNRYLKGRRT
jgi:hypothetical protein